MKVQKNIFRKSERQSILLIKNSIVFVPVFIFLLMLIGCAVQNNPHNMVTESTSLPQNIGRDYIPTKESVPAVNRYKARLLLEDALEKCVNNTYGKRELGKIIRITPPIFSEGNVELEFKPSFKDMMNGSGAIIRYKINFSTIIIPPFEYRRKQGTQLAFIINGEKLYILGVSYEVGKQLVDALYILKYNGQQEDQKELDEFKPIAQQYRALAVKPELKEEARRYLVQASMATDEKRYMDAIDLLEKAISIDPTYPQAHFNRALLWVQFQSYADAILEMKKYLLLVPDATDARASQDKIYEWEGKMTK